MTHLARRGGQCEQAGPVLGQPAALCQPLQLRAQPSILALSVLPPAPLAPAAASSVPAPPRISATVSRVISSRDSLSSAPPATRSTARSHRAARLPPGGLLPHASRSVMVPDGLSPVLDDSARRVKFTPDSTLSIFC